MGTQVDERKVEQDLEMLERFCRTAWQSDLQNVEALIERLQVEMIVQRYPRRKKAIYRAVIDYMEDVLERRYEKIEDDRDTVRQDVLDYVAKLIQGLKP